MTRNNSQISFMKHKHTHENIEQREKGVMMVQNSEGCFLISKGKIFIKLVFY